MTLTKEEIEIIQRDAEELYPGWKGGGSFTHKANHIASLQQEAHCRCATKYLLQLKAERERAGKLMEALGKWKQAHKNFDTGYKNIDGKTTRVDISILSMECNSADRNLLTAINEYNKQP